MTNELNATITETLRQGERELGCITLTHRYASRADSLAVDLRVSKECEANSRFVKYTGKIIVMWSARSPRGWGKNYKATFNTVADAETFAATKWPVCLAWLGRQPENTRNGAVDAFSESLVGMVR